MPFLATLRDALYAAIDLLRLLRDALEALNAVLTIAGQIPASLSALAYQWHQESRLAQSIPARRQWQWLLAPRSYTSLLYTTQLHAILIS